MSRMFRIITGGNGSQDPRPVAAVQISPADIFSASDVPFVEVGGPEGLISSIAGRPSPARANGPKLAQSNGNPPAATVQMPTIIQMPATLPMPQLLPMPNTVQMPATTFQMPTGLPGLGSNRVDQPRPTVPAEPIRPITSASPLTESRVLSVTFHRFPKHGLRVMDTGVAPEIVAYHFPDHPVSSEYRIVRDELLKQYEEPGPKVIAFTAASAVAGTTTVMLNVAATLTQDHGYRVLLVDANFSRPGVARRLSASDTPGLAEVLGQTLPLAWALQPTPLLNLHVLAGGNPSDETEGSLATDFPRLMAQLRQWFDWVVIDAGVWADFPAAGGMTSTCDGLYLVSRDTDLERPDFTQMRADLTAAGGAVRGFISTHQ